MTLLRSGRGQGGREELVSLSVRELDRHEGPNGPCVPFSANGNPDSPALRVLGSTGDQIEYARRQARGRCRSAGLFAKRKGREKMPIARRQIDEHPLAALQAKRPTEPRTREGPLLLKRRAVVRHRVLQRRPGWRRFPESVAKRLLRWRSVLVVEYAQRHSGTIMDLAATSLAQQAPWTDREGNP